MGNGTKKSLMGLAAIVLVGTVVYGQRAALSTRILARGLEAAMTADLEDGLHVALCGAGRPVPDPRRSGPCVAVVAGPHLFVVDAGTGGLRNLGRMRYPTGRIEAVLLTHSHSDHIDGLGELATILDYHASPVEAAETAREAGVGHLLYYHVVPPLTVPGLEAACLEGVDEVFPDHTVGRDGTAFSMPAGSDEIVRTRTGL